MHDPAPLTEREFRQIAELVRRETGISLGPSKLALVSGRLARRLRHHGCRSYGEYYDLVCSDATGDELLQLINSITTNKTAFFRESHHFDALRERLHSVLRRTGRPVRIWSAGCSTGEEAYT